MGYRPLTDALLGSIRMYQRHKARPGTMAMPQRKAARVAHTVLSVLIGSDIDVGFQFGRNLHLPHPTGVVVHRGAVIGDDCMVMRQVTLGQLATGSVPVVGSRVYIGAGAQVLGPVHIGDDARIGANAVVLKDVPAGATAVGVPAKVVSRSQPGEPVRPAGE